MKKKTQIIIISFVAAIFAVQINAHAQEATDFEQYFVLIEKAIQAQNANPEAVWLGYDLTQYPIALYNRSATYLINHPDPGDEFEATSRTIAGLPVHYTRKQFKEFNRKNGVQYNNHIVFPLKVTGNPAAKTFYELLFHETFHGFARSANALKNRYGNSLVRPFFPLNDSDFYALAYVEQQLLKEAISAADEAQTKRKIQEYFNIFYRRMGLLHEAFSEYEYMEQIHEGLAEYAGYRGMELMGFGDTITDSLALKLDKKVERPEEVRDRIYWTGAALALLLDRIYPEWKEGLTASINLIQLLRVNVPPDDQIDQDAVLERYDFLKLRFAMSRNLYLHRRALRKLKSDLEKSNRVEIVFPPSSRPTVFFEPMEIHAINDTTVYHENFLMLQSHDRFTIEVEGQNALTHIQRRNVFLVKKLVLEESAISELLIDGSQIPKLNIPSREFKELVLDSELAKIKVKKGKIRRERNKIVIIIEG